jgi:hypothetical protein
VQENYDVEELGEGKRRGHFQGMAIKIWRGNFRVMSRRGMEIDGQEICEFFEGKSRHFEGHFLNKRGIKVKYSSQ